jgi:hypothetical protein
VQKQVGARHRASLVIPISHLLTFA